MPAAHRLLRTSRSIRTAVLIRSIPPPSLHASSTFFTSPVSSCSRTSSAPGRVRSCNCGSDVSKRWARARLMPDLQSSGVLSSSERPFMAGLTSGSRHRRPCTRSPSLRRSRRLTALARGAMRSGFAAAVTGPVPASGTSMMNV